MADSKITALASIGTGTDPANDPLVIVDVSDILPGGMSLTGTTKKVTLNNLLACSPTATLASATITGDLTVDTNTLKVDSANNRVGVGTAAPAAGYSLDVAGNVRANSSFQTTDGTNTGVFGTNVLASGVVGICSGTNVPLVFGVNATEQMRLNSTGLGVGGAPVNPLTVFAASSAKAPALLLSTVGSPTYGWDFSVDGAVNGNLFIRRLVGGVKTDVLEFDRSNGNVGIAVTPSAWESTFKAIQINNRGAYISATSNSFSTAPFVHVGNNGYYDSVNARWQYVTANTASQYVQAASSHYWYTAASGAAGAAITDFATPKMTLDASGNLILLSSNTPATLTTNGQLTVNATSNTNLRFSYRGSDGVTRVANLTLA